MTVSDVVCIKPGESYIGSIPLKEFIFDDINAINRKEFQ